MTAATEIVMVSARWDRTGWYVMTYTRVDGRLIEADDSQKVWFPVDVDGFDQGQGDDLRGELQEAFPAADIVIID